MEEEIRQTMKTRGWKHIEQMFIDSTVANLSSIDTRQTAEEIATQYIGKLNAEQIVKSVIAKLEMMSYEGKDQTISYK